MAGPGRSQSPSDGQLFHQAFNLDVFEFTGLDETHSGAGAGRVSGGQGGLEKNSDVSGLALHTPIGLSQAQGLAGLMLQMEREAGFFTLMHLITPTPTAFESGLKSLDVGNPLWVGRVQRGLRQTQPQEQRIRPRLTLQQRRHFPCPSQVQKKIGIGTDQIGVALAQSQSRTIVPLCFRNPAKPGRGFGQNREAPKLLGDAGISVALEHELQRATTR